MIGSRLSNPKNIDITPEKFSELQAKISTAMNKMYKIPENGGNPFLFGYAASKDHELRRSFGTFERPFKTAATDGKKFYWNDEFLDELSVEEIMIVMEHEATHVVLFHCSRGKEKNKIIWNIATDYICNASIIHDFEFIRENGKKRKGTPFNSPGLGKPLPFKEFLKQLDEQKALIEQNEAATSIGKPMTVNELTKKLKKMMSKGKKNIKPDEKRMFADQSLYGRSPESVYNEIQDHWPPDPPKNKNGDKSCDDGEGQDASGMTDEHIPTVVNKQEVQADVARAAEFSSKMRGSLSAEVQSFLVELSSPSVSFTDLVRNAMYRKVIDAGKNNDWKHLRRRYINMGLYLPRRYMHVPRFLAMLDTSGSMHETDMAYGISQLLALKGCEGIVVPCDSAPKWQDAVKIDKVDVHALQSKVKVVGRGGTTFADFFRDYPTKIGKNFDVVIVLTDSYCDNIPIQYKPKNCEVVWVVTSNNIEFKPTFGRVAHVRQEQRM